MSTAFGFAPPVSTSSRQLVNGYAAAQCSAVRPFSSAALGSQPAPISIATTSSPPADGIMQRDTANTLSLAGIGAVTKQYLHDIEVSEIGTVVHDTAPRWKAIVGVGSSPQGRFDRYHVLKIGGRDQLLI